MKPCKVGADTKRRESGGQEWQLSIIADLYAACVRRSAHYRERNMQAEANAFEHLEQWMQETFGDLARPQEGGIEKSSESG